MLVGKDVWTGIFSKVAGEVDYGEAELEERALGGVGLADPDVVQLEHRLDAVFDRVELLQMIEIGFSPAHHVHVAYYGIV